jgi:hypothetical protein
VAGKEDLLSYKYVEVAKAITHTSRKLFVGCGCAVCTTSHDRAMPPTTGMGTTAEAAMAVEAETKKTDRKKGGMRTMPYIFGKQTFFIDSVAQ